MKKNSLLWLAAASLLAFTFTGCVTASIAKPDIPMAEQCVVVVTDFGNKKVTYGNIKLDGVGFGRHSTVVPAGKHRIQVSEEKKYTVSSSSSSYTVGSTKYTEYNETYIPYTETWRSEEYEFTPGKSYRIKIKNAKLGYKEKILASGDPGVRIRVNGQDVTVENEGNIEITEYDGGMSGSTYRGLIFVPDYELTFWDHGQTFFKYRVGPRLGLQTIHGNFETIISADAGGEIGVGVPGFDSWGFPFGYYYGGSLSLYFAQKVGLSFGGGMTGGAILASKFDDLSNSSTIPYYFPYAEFDLLFCKPADIGLGIGLRYNFNDSENWYDKFSVGLKIRY